MTQFYSYLWLRAAVDSPWYVGKGSGNRAYQRRKGHWAPNRSRIFVFPQDSEADAFESERALIWLFGRKDLGTGRLQNISDGGEGGSNPAASTREKQAHAKRGNKINLGRRRSPEARARMAIAQLGQIWSSERKAKNRASHLGRIYKKRKPATAARRQQLRENWLGRKHAPESIAKMRLAAKIREEEKFIKTVAYG